MLKLLNVSSGFGMRSRAWFVLELLEIEIQKKDKKCCINCLFLYSFFVVVLTAIKSFIENNKLFISSVTTQCWFVMLNIQAVGGGSEISLFSRMLTQALSRMALHRNSKNLRIYLTSKNPYILPHSPYVTLHFSLCLNFLQLEDSLYRGLLHFVPSEDKEKVSQKGMKIERFKPEEKRR